MAGYTDPVWIEHEGYPCDWDAPEDTLVFMRNNSETPRVGMIVRPHSFDPRVALSCHPSHKDRIGVIVAVNRTTFSVRKDP